MTRKDYVKIADAIKGALDTCKSQDERLGVAKAIGSISGALALDNPRFDNDRFIAACFGDDIKNEKPTAYEWEVQGNYDGRDWDCVFTAESAREAGTTLREYRENEPGIIFRVRKVKVA